MIDRETGSIWTHLDGKAIQGPMEGKRMTMVPLPQMTWVDWKQSQPDTMILSPDTPFANRYRPVQIARYRQNEDRFGDDRLAANALVVGVEVKGSFKGYPIAELRVAGGVINDTLNDQSIVVIYDSVSQTGMAYSRANGEELEFYNASNEGFEFRDRTTDSLWNQQGHAVAGILAGRALDFVPSFISEWYGWSGYHPETEIYALIP